MARCLPLGTWQSAQTSFELSMKAFNETIGHWMVCYHPDAGSSKEAHELVPKVVLGLCAAISGDCEWGSEMDNPARDKGLDDCGCSHVW